MKVILVLAIVLVLMDNVLANPLLEGGLAARTLCKKTVFVVFIVNIFNHQLPCDCEKHKSVKH